jgi:hypothetical protein
MEWRLGRRTARATAYSLYSPAILTIAALALTGCNLQDGQTLSAARPRGATVAFESIDGPPPAQFHRLVQNLNKEAQTRRLAVVSRDNPSAYRVRGYLSAEVVNGKTTISWVWDVFDRDRHRALRISGAETAKGKDDKAWQVADKAMLQRIAHSSMGELAAFLTSPGVAPGAPGITGGALMALASPSSPEAAGIFRIFHPEADPVSVADDAASPAAVPLPRKRPPPAETVTFAASRRSPR